MHLGNGRPMGRRGWAVALGAGPICRCRWRVESGQAHLAAGRIACHARCWLRPAAGKEGSGREGGGGGAEWAVRRQCSQAGPRRMRQHAQQQQPAPGRQWAGGHDGAAGRAGGGGHLGAPAVQLHSLHCLPEAASQQQEPLAAATSAKTLAWRPGARGGGRVFERYSSHFSASKAANRAYLNISQEPSTGARYEATAKGAGSTVNGVSAEGTSHRVVKWYCASVRLV